MARIFFAFAFAFAFALLLTGPALSMDLGWEDLYPQGALVDTRPVLGLQAGSMSPELRQHMGAPSDRGLLVQSVEKGSAAAQAGVQVGDVLLELDGAALSSPTSLRRLLSGSSGEIELKLLRGKKERSLKLKVVEQPFAAPNMEGLEELEDLLPQLGQELERLMEELDMEELGRKLGEFHWEGLSEDLEKKLEGLDKDLDALDLDALELDSLDLESLELDPEFLEQLESWGKLMEEMFENLGLDMDQMLKDFEGGLELRPEAEPSRAKPSAI